MTIPLDNLYDYIFDLTEHTNKNLIMYRFHPHGSKNIKDLTVHNNVDNIRIYYCGGGGSFSYSCHYKLLFCYDQEPLNFDLYAGDYFDNERKKLFDYWQKELSQYNDPIGKKLIKKRNIAGHPQARRSIYNKTLLLHSEKNSKDLKKYEKNGFLGIYYWSHAFLALDWYRFAKHDENFNYSFTSSVDKDFNIYCRAWTGSREYRLKFLSSLPNPVSKNSNIFFSEKDKNINFYEYKPQNTKWMISQREVQKITNLNYIIRNNHHSGLSATYNVKDYHMSAIDVVLETVYDQNKIQLTEKILRPIACGKPFILLSEKGSLEYLKSYGFKTFNNLIDESYDNIKCPKKRLKKIVKLMKSISLLPQDKKNQLFFEMHKIAEFNKNWFFSEEFFNIINNELKRNLKNGFKILDKPEYQTAKFPNLEFRTYRRYLKYLSNNKKICAKFVVSEHPKIIELSKKNIGKY